MTEFRALLPVLGIDTEFSTNDSRVLGVVNEAFGGWGKLERRVADAALRMAIRITVREGEDDGDVRHVLPDSRRFVAQSSGSIGSVDPASREAVAFVTPALVADHPTFRSAMLEAMTFALLAQFDRHPLHAAAVASGGRVVLLVGESGAGKSTLAYAAHESGFDVLAEDHAWIQLDPELRVWGGATRIRLEAGTAQSLPDARGTMSTAGGTTKFVVDLTPATLVGTEPVVCLLSRGGGDAAIERIDAETITRALTGGVSPGFDRFPERHTRVVRALAASGGWRLRLSSDPWQSVALLDTLLRGAVVA
ncbi:MAG: hypothetical protein ACREPM_02755 [Gemmatimonadaceae bacterium]